MGGRGAFQLKKSLECQHPAWRCAGSAPLKRGGANKKAPQTPKIANTSPPCARLVSSGPRAERRSSLHRNGGQQVFGLGGGGWPRSAHHRWTRWPGRGGRRRSGSGCRTVVGTAAQGRGPRRAPFRPEVAGFLSERGGGGGGGRHPLTCYWTFLSRTSGSGTVRRVDRGLDVLQVPWQTVHFLGTDVAELHQKWPFRGASNSSIYVFVAQCHRNFLASARINVDIGHGIRIWQ